MIHRNHETLQLPDWQSQLASAIKTPEALIAALQLPESSMTGIVQAHQQFPIRIPLSFLSRMKKGDINDPLLRQVLPVQSENIAAVNFVKDPVGDSAAIKTDGLLHKYHGRVLLTMTGACGIHCRYCFRRHFDYSASNPSGRQWNNCIDYIKNDKSIFEVILSGGDPLSLSDKKLSRFVDDITRISHVNLLRIHTRQIVVLPDRVNEQLLNWLDKLSIKCVIVVHVNHPAEIDDNVRIAFAKLKNTGVELLNQSVLLKGVNNDASILQSLSLKLFNAGVKPYYLHLLDKVMGAQHFECNENVAHNIMHQLRSTLPGYLVPQLVREIEDQQYKIPQNRYPD